MVSPFGIPGLTAFQQVAPTQPTGDQNVRDDHSTDNRPSPAADKVNDQSSDPSSGAGRDHAAEDRAGDIGQKKTRSVSACLACRGLKVRCIRGSSAHTATPCHRCAHLGVPCEIPKCRRGRVPGSRNKQRSQRVEIISPSPEHAPLPHVTNITWSAQADPGVELDSGVYHNGANTLDSLSPKEAMEGTEDLNLPVESAHQSPDPEDSHMQDGPHPLSLLSDIGSRLRSNEDERAQQSSVDPSVLGEIPSDIGPGWTRAQLQTAATRKRYYFRHGLSATKRDILPSLDPISKGILSEDVAETLVRGFFQWLHPQVGIMDPALHTVDYMRKHSALLLTSVLAASAQTRQRDGDRTLALRLYAHAERLYLVVLTTNAKSAELVWALLVLYLWPKFPKQNVDDRSRIYLTLTISMAVELGFPNLSQTVTGDEQTRRRHRDKVRAWTALYIHDRSLSAFSGRPPMIKAHAGVDKMRSWLADDLVTAGDHMIVGYLELRAIENDARNQLGHVKIPSLINAIKTTAIGQLETWSDDWCLGRLVQAGPDFAHVMHYVSLHISLLIATKGSQGDGDHVHRTEALRLARSSIRYFLLNMYAQARYTIRTVSAMIAWDAIVYLKLAGSAARGLVRSVGLAMAPHGDCRMDYTPAHFYGSLLIELSFAQERDIFNEMAQPPLPSPSNLWLLDRPLSSVEPALDIPINSSLAESLAALANDETSHADENLLSILGHDVGTGGFSGGVTDCAPLYQAWPTTLDLNSSSSTQLPTTSSQDIFSGSQGDIEQNWHGIAADMGGDWSWLFQSGSGQDN